MDVFSHDPHAFTDIELGSLALTLLFAALLLGVGLFSAPVAHCGWVAMSDVISILLGLMLLSASPASGLWFIGFASASI